jgi:hypothetical protein
MLNSGVYNVYINDFQINDTYLSKEDAKEMAKWYKEDDNIIVIKNIMNGDETKC